MGPRLFYYIDEMSLVKELLTDVIALFTLSGIQRLQPCATGIEYCTGRLPDAHQIVAILARQNEIVLAAIETAAQERSPVVDGATRRPQVDARTVTGGKQVYRIAFAVGQHLVLIRLHVVTMVGMEEKTLIAAAAFDALATGNVGLVGGRQILL